MLQLTELELRVAEAESRAEDAEDKASTCSKDVNISPLADLLSYFITVVYEFSPHTSPMVLKILGYTKSATKGVF